MNISFGLIAPLIQVLLVLVPIQFLAFRSRARRKGMSLNIGMALLLSVCGPAIALAAASIVLVSVMFGPMLLFPSNPLLPWFTMLPALLCSLFVLAKSMALITDRWTNFASRTPNHEVAG